MAGPCKHACHEDQRQARWFGNRSGDEEEPCLEVCLLMKRCIPTAGLAILPKSGHGINLEEPELFNRLLEDFFHQVEAGRWGARDPRATIPSIYGAGGKP